MIINKQWREVAAGDLLYVVTHSQYLLMFNKIDFPEMFTAHVESVEKSDGPRGLIECVCVRDDNTQKFKIYINGYFPSMMSAEINGVFYEMNKSKSYLASFKMFDSDDMCRVAAFDKELYNAYIISVRDKAREKAKQKISIIKEQLKIINQNLKEVK